VQRRWASTKSELPLRRVAGRVAGEAQRREVCASLEVEIIRVRLLQVVWQLECTRQHNEPTFSALVKIKSS
jgi:hypothetical protein